MSCGRQLTAEEAEEVKEDVRRLRNALASLLGMLDESDVKVDHTEKFCLRGFVGEMLDHNDWMKG